MTTNKIYAIEDYYVCLTDKYVLAIGRNTTKGLKNLKKEEVIKFKRISSLADTMPKVDSFVPKRIDDEYAIKLFNILFNKDFISYNDRLYNGNKHDLKDYFVSTIELPTNNIIATTQVEKSGALKVTTINDLNIYNCLFLTANSKTYNLNINHSTYTGNKIMYQDYLTEHHKDNEIGPDTSLNTIKALKLFRNINKG